MAELVPADQIEGIVGVDRHATEHWGRAVSAEETVYILHSQECQDSDVDLRRCPFTLALDRGIQHYLPWSGWRHVQDRPVRLEIFQGFLVPDLLTVKEVLRG